ncbi:hypothetical protein LguiA_012533 [Lonicera macranthoides]
MRSLLLCVQLLKKIHQLTLNFLLCTYHRPILSLKFAYKLIGLLLIDNPMEELRVRIPFNCTFYSSFLVP